jgi:hypothetical protein
MSFSLTHSLGWRRDRTHLRALPLRPASALHLRPQQRNLETGVSSTRALGPCTYIQSDRARSFCRCSSIQSFVGNPGRSNSVCDIRLTINPANHCELPLRVFHQELRRGEHRPQFLSREFWVECGLLYQAVDCGSDDWVGVWYDGDF